MNDDPAYKKIERAKLRLILQRQPFFGVLFSHLKPVRVDDPKLVDTMATDGRKLYYYPPFVESLSDEELMFVCAHEVLHNALEHHIRRKDREPDAWNIAGDFVINASLIAGRVGTMPKGGLHDPQFDGLTTEEIYNRLPKDGGKGGGRGNGASDPGRCGGVIDGAPSYDEAAIAELRAENQVRVRQAASMARAQMAGKLPAELQRLIDELTEPKVNWADELRRLVARSLSIAEPTWSRPNRRYLHAGLYLPGTIPDAIDEIVVAIDTSGSISGPILNAFASEVNGILGDGHVDKIRVVYADAKVQGVQEFSRGDLLTLDPKGGGGTAFSDTFNWVRENAPDAAAVVYLTDLYVSDFGEAPDCPVIWTVAGTKQEFEQNSAKVPFGDAVHIVAD